MRVEILCTGDEILTGKTINTNYSHMARRLGDLGLTVHWGTTVGDDRASLLQAFRQAGERADAVIVNGGLGPTVDDLSQEVAAEACGVELVLSDYWMTRMTESYARRGRVMPPNNRKQAMLPANAEFIDNPIGTACGFAVTIGKARFFFTPGVPREMRRMLDEQVIPRLLKLGGITGVTRLKRFHSFGIGESRADNMLADMEVFKNGGDIKLGFQAHYPQLETKLAVHGEDEADLLARLAPVEAEVRKRLGNFIIAEDDQTLEGVILATLLERGHTLSTAEMFSGGHLAARTVGELAGLGDVGAENESHLLLGKAFQRQQQEGLPRQGRDVRQPPLRRQRQRRHVGVLVDRDRIPYLGEQAEQSGTRTVPFVEQRAVLQQGLQHGPDIGVARGLVPGQRTGIAPQQRQMFSNEL